jgi:ABC-type phosphate/phosphonate transport system ATPase subunit
MLLRDLDIAVAPSPGAEPPALLIEDLHFAYPDGHVALRGATLSVARGEKVALVGPNGAGKSTLLLHLNGILRGKGYIAIGGVPVNERNLPQVRARVGLVFQNPMINCSHQLSSRMSRSVRSIWGYRQTTFARGSNGRLRWSGCRRTETGSRIV